MGTWQAKPKYNYHAYQKYLRAQGEALDLYDLAPNKHS
jgi:hypothetical protein